MNYSPSITLAVVPGEYISLAKADLARGSAVGERCAVVTTVPPWTIGEVRITFDWFIPATRGSLSFWRAVNAEQVEGSERSERCRTSPVMLRPLVRQVRNLADEAD